MFNAGGEGFEPSTPNLGGWCSIREESKSPSTSPLPVQETRTPQSVLSYSPKILKQQHRVNIDTKTLLKIEEVKLHLEAKAEAKIR